MLFLIPGVIAFGVDFETEAVYLPSKRSKAGTGIEQDDMVVIKVNPDDITLAMLEKTLEQRKGEKINLHSENVQVYQIREDANIETQLVMLDK